MHCVQSLGHLLNGKLLKLEQPWYTLLFWTYFKVVIRLPPTMSSYGHNQNPTNSNCRFLVLCFVFCDHPGLGFAYLAS